jgi:uncharacterized membrane protein
MQIGINFTNPWDKLAVCLFLVNSCTAWPVAEFFIIGERFIVITRQLQATKVLSKLSTMNDKSSFFKVPVVITKQLVITTQLKLYFNNSSRIPTQLYSTC